MIISPDCRIAIYVELLVVLDLRTSVYRIYDSNISSSFSKWYFSAPRKLPINCDSLISDRVLIPNVAGSVIKEFKVYDYRNKQFDVFDSSDWSTRSLQRRSGRVSGRAVSSLIWRAFLLKLYGFRCLSLLNRKLGIVCARDSGPIDICGVVARYSLASMWSPLKITCLQFSFAVASHLRSSNVPAQLVIGVRPLPFSAHAWVEVHGEIVGDQPPTKHAYGEIYRTPEYA